MSALVHTDAALGLGTAAQLSYLALLPMLVVLGAALLGVLVEAFVPQRSRQPVQLAVALLGLLAAGATVFLYAMKHQGRAVGVIDQHVDGSSSVEFPSVVIDGPVLFLQVLVLVFGILGVLLMAERFGGPTSDAFTAMGADSPGSATEEAALRRGRVTTEVFPLTMFAVAGMMLFPASGDLITMFVALEVLSLPLYILSGLARRRRLLSQEASLKYFLLGAFSSAFYLFGAALLYGYAGSISFDRIAAAVSAAEPGLEPLLVGGTVLVLMGLLFKVGAVPFHAWTPDVYQGAPTPVTAFMAAATKAAAFGAILRFLYMGVAGALWDWQVALVIVAVLTMVVGAVLTVVQTDLKRLLAYSSIAHAGFILVGVLAMDRSGVSSVLFYLATYGLSTMAAFALLTLVRQGGNEATRIEQWRGIGRRHPVIALVLALLLASFAGIPLTSGFIAKLAVFAAAVGHGGATGTVLAVIGVLCSLITVFAYFRVIRTMYFAGTGATAAGHAREGEEVAAVTPSVLTTFTIALGTFVTVALGVWPSALLDIAERCSRFIQ